MERRAAGAESALVAAQTTNKALREQLSAQARATRDAKRDATVRAASKSAPAAAGAASAAEGAASAVADALRDIYEGELEAARSEAEALRRQIEGAWAGRLAADPVAAGPSGQAEVAKGPVGVERRDREQSAAEASGAAGDGAGGEGAGGALAGLGSPSEMAEALKAERKACLAAKAAAARAEAALGAVRAANRALQAAAQDKADVGGAAAAKRVADSEAQVGFADTVVVIVRSVWRSAWIQTKCNPSAALQVRKLRTQVQKLEGQLKGAQKSAAPSKKAGGATKAPESLSPDAFEALDKAYSAELAEQGEGVHRVPFTTMASSAVRCSHSKVLCSFIRCQSRSLS